METPNVSGDNVLAYAFWHWPKPSADRSAYEAAQLQFQRSLAAAPSPGFIRSASYAIAGAPWANQGGDAYQDWYIVRGTTALDPLDEAAITASRKGAHDAAASLAAGGTAGLYRLRLGELPSDVRWAHWFSKPAGLTYPQLFGAVEPALTPVGGSLWVRKMTLGPAPEFCVLARQPAQLAPQFQMVAIPLRPVWEGTNAEMASR
jgi:hypothetical protein